MARNFFSIHERTICERNGSKMRKSARQQPISSSKDYSLLCDVVRTAMRIYWRCIGNGQHSVCERAVPPQAAANHRAAFLVCGNSTRSNFLVPFFSCHNRNVSTRTYLRMYVIQLALCTYHWWRAHTHWPAELLSTNTYNFRCRSARPDEFSIWKNIRTYYVH